MDLSKIKPAKGAVKNNKRLGRGEGSGFGDTASKGHKGQLSRAGYKRRSGFEGGQMPLVRRVPKFGFKNPFRVQYVPVNLDTIQELATKKGIQSFNLDVFINHGLANKRDKIKILGRGELTGKVDVEAHAFSQKAVKAIEEQGGTTTNLSKKPKN